MANCTEFVLCFPYTSIVAHRAACYLGRQLPQLRSLRDNVYFKG